MATATEILNKAKVRLVINHPFLATILMGMPLKEMDEDVRRYQTEVMGQNPTAATDGSSIVYAPEFIESLTPDECMFVLAHEVMHVALLHPFRRETREPQAWNKACDYSENDILKQCGFQLIKGSLHNPGYAGKSAEEIYHSFPPEEKNGQGSGDPLGNDVLPPKGSAADRQRAESEAKLRITQAANVAKAKGNLPAALKKLIDDVLETKLNWREELRRFMTAVLKTDQSWQRGQRRFLAQGLYLPAFHTPGMGHVVVGIDTSGSVYDEAPEFLAEVRSICEECKPEKITVIQCDAEVTAVDEYEPGDEIKADVKGGGGTDLRHIFAEVDELGIEPQVLVVLTDLETPHGDDPGYPVIWAATTKHDIPFGDVVRL